MSIYLDYNAGAPLWPEAAVSMSQAIDRLRQGGNPSSQHQQGRVLRHVIEDARESVAALAAALPEEVVFTSCATESAATVLSDSWDEVVLSGLEHSCIRESVRCRVRQVQVRSDGVIDLAALRRELAQGGGRRLVAITAASHETGVIQPVSEVALIAGELGAEVYCDAAQALGRTQFCFGSLGIAFAGVSSSKIGGPPGTGALLVRRGTKVSALLSGGGQESRRRAGTENSIGIAGFGAAASRIRNQNWKAVAGFRDRFEHRLCEFVPQARIFGAAASRLPNVSCLAIPGWQAGPLVMALDLEGFSVGAGSACSSGKFEPARSLHAMNPEVGARDSSAAIRISLAPDVGAADLEGLLDALVRLARRRLRLAA